MAVGGEGVAVLPIVGKVVGSAAAVVVTCGEGSIALFVPVGEGDAVLPRLYPKRDAPIATTAKTVNTQLASTHFRNESERFACSFAIHSDALISFGNTTLSRSRTRFLLSVSFMLLESRITSRMLLLSDWIFLRKATATNVKINAINANAFVAAVGIAAKN